MGVLGVPYGLSEARLCSLPFFSLICSYSFPLGLFVQLLLFVC